jgi:hypothetical protein
MTKFEKIKGEIEALPDDQRMALKAWLDEIEAERFDAKIEADAASGRLDGMIAKARANDKAGRRTPLSAGQVWRTLPMRISGRSIVRCPRTSDCELIRLSRCCVSHLAVHRSQRAQKPAARRVIHLEYTAVLASDH